MAVRIAVLLRGQDVGREDLWRGGEQLVGVGHQGGSDLAVDVSLTWVFAAERIEDTKTSWEKFARRTNRRFPARLPRVAERPPASRATSSSAFSRLASIRTTNTYGLDMFAPV
jgi:hypothetical protein